MKILLSLVTFVLLLPTLSAEGKEVRVQCAPGLQFDIKTINVKVGTTLTIKFSNPDQLEHNFVVVKPGKAKAVGLEAAKLNPSEKATHNYVPQHSDVVAHSKLIGKGGADSVTVKFDTAGTYPYICTAPGHYSIMKGSIIVK